MDSPLRAGLRLFAVTLGLAHAGFLFFLGSQLPADDIIWGDLGVYLTMGAFALALLTIVAWSWPLAGGTALMILGGLFGAVGFSLTILAGLAFGAPSLSGFLFVGTRVPAEVT